MPAQVETMAYARAVPWHGIGLKVDGLQKAEEMLIAAGLDWKVEAKPMYTLAPRWDRIAAEWGKDDEPIEVPGLVANIRSSDGAFLGAVGTGYKIVQNAEAFDWADSLVDDGSAKYETAGALMGGRRVFLSMELPSGISVPGDTSEIKPYILITNGHDGGTMLQASVTMVRVVCANTWTLALKEATRTFRIRHTGSMEGKLLAAREALGITFKYVDAFQAAAEHLSALKVTDKRAERIFASLYPVPKRAKGDEEKIAATSFGELRTLYQESENLAPIRGTGWGVLQAVGEYVDHEVTYRGRRFEADEVRMDSILYDGPAAAKKQRALALLTARPR